jgi:hypothetical protein
MRNYIVQIDGGIGKCVAATALCKSIRENNQDSNIIVISAYPEVFLNNPNVNKALQFGSITYFYDDYIKGKDFKLMAQNPYLETNYINKSKHLIEVWCDMNNLQYKGYKPEIFLNQREIDFFQKKYQSDKPIFVLQTNGGANENLKYSFARDLPSKVVLKIIEHFSPKYNIVHVRRENQIGYDKTNPIHAGFREILALTLLSEKRLLIDSFLQHSCAALNLPSTVCWITNSPKSLGYELHDNIIANPFTKSAELRHSFYEEFDINGNPEQFPYNSEDEIFNVDDIVASLEKNNK